MRYDIISNNIKLIDENVIFVKLFIEFEDYDISKEPKCLFCSYLAKLS